MSDIKLSVPEDVKRKVEKLSDIDWSNKFSSLVDEEFKRRMLLEFFDKALENSKLTDKQALEMGRKVNKALAKRYGLL